MTGPGRLYERGLGVTQDLSVAQDRYREAIAAGDTTAQVDLDRVLAAQQPPGRRRPSRSGVVRLDGTTCRSP
ncbi:SEL1-like repeat protein [Modestobacter italicus]|uniref:SEL1-like repeat protein n=1 Tax=Modestobacter italicus (strain DSM 44449 / CECT 9708 / BC 501) TaxID=2732864 RepID=UPI001C985101|nr:SEL1-like repeat protein [Modestobacter italicus]